MEERERRIGVVKRYLYAITGGSAVTIYLMYYQGLFVKGHDLATSMMMLSDAFFIPGAIMVGLGLLIWVAGEGVFDMMIYGVKLLWDVAFKHEWESFRDYQSRKAEKEKNKVGFLIYVGLTFLVIGGAFTGLFFVFS